MEDEEEQYHSIEFVSNHSTDVLHIEPNPVFVHELVDIDASHKKRKSRMVVGEIVADGVAAPPFRQSTTSRVAFITKSMSRFRDASYKMNKQICRQIPNSLFLPLILLITLLILASALIPIYFAVSAGDGLEFSYPGNMTELNIKKFNGLAITGRVVDIEPQMFSVTIMYTILPGGVIASSNAFGVVDIPDGTMLSVSLGIQSVTYETNSALQLQTAQLLVSDVVSLMHYPFDKYSASFPISSALVADPQRPSQSADYVLGPAGVFPIPCNAIFLVSSEGYTVNMQIIPREFSDVYNRTLDVAVSIERTLSTQLFSVFIVMIMWLISLALFFATIFRVVSREVDSLELPALSITLLFTLPFIRDVQPDVPPLGCLVDLMGFFWNMFLIAASALIALWCVLSAYRQKVVLKEEPPV